MFLLSMIFWSGPSALNNQKLTKFGRLQIYRDWLDRNFSPGKLLCQKDHFRPFLVVVIYRVNLLSSEIIAQKPCAKGDMFHFKKMHLFIVPSNSFSFQRKNARLLTDISTYGNYLGVNMSSWILQLRKTNSKKRWQRETIRLPFVRQKGLFLEAFWLVFGSPICSVCHIYPWNPNDLYFWRDPTPQKQGRNSNQNKGHFDRLQGSMYQQKDPWDWYIYLHEWLIFMVFM